MEGERPISERGWPNQPLPSPKTSTLAASSRIQKAFMLLILTAYVISLLGQDGQAIQDH